MTRNEIFYNLIDEMNDGGITYNDGGFRHMDFWNANTDYLEQEEPFDLPALFVEFGQVDYQPVKSGDAPGRCDVMLHVVCSLADTTMPDSLRLCDRAVECASRAEGFRCRVQSLTNHNHAELVEHIEVVRFAL